MQKKGNVGVQDDICAGLMALGDSMDSCFAYIGHYQTGEISYVSKSLETILGYSQEYFLKKGVDALRSIVHPDDMKGIVLILSELMKEYQINYTTGNCSNNSKVVNYHFRAKHINNQWVPIDQKVFVITQTENGMADLIFSILSTKVTFIEEALADEGLNGKREKLLSYLEYARIHSNNQLKVNGNSAIVPSKGLIEMTTHLNPVRDISAREKEVL
ncbi:MAG TPA: PAS domain-containing protein, partial [Segetibacter sp.]